MPFQRVKEAIEAIKNGEMIIIMDNENRENEGDLVFAAEFSTAEKINFMAQEARGLICVSITQDIASQLGLKPMVKKNNSNHNTAFTVSIDAKEAKTGISAFERDLTIRLMCNPHATSDDFVKPGHIFPLIAKKNGVLVRDGHTEASIDICALAGLKQISVICEIMKKDGSMARRGDKFLLEFAKEYQLKTLYVSDLITYRLRFEQLLECTSQTTSFFLGTPCKRFDFCDYFSRVHTALVFGEKSQQISLFKFHYIHSDIELLSNQAEFEQLMHSIKILKDSGGILVFLQMSPSCNKIQNTGIKAQIIRYFNITDFSLFTDENHKEDEWVNFCEFGLNPIKYTQDNP
ncbi:bifunctional 3,4-dihydroxy-2-butanone 4-phosphate synthase/GTP cyclohydrolase II [Helicobacter monodelphidis]|uniref:bifunctional 3,4-dihydroxy-2-butanone 4-phosphate synthase/GTP cyclohydrolase II n=1 Tax=Helicobacter sp. 15-1451 TaxID=2004995 RepID=UPI000DCC9FEC|nr:bifunctional 3,4-dihydroxy-2-butanone 4-phosphate synthase/GTP cyclohydrolase II [Helicobacter sp. 15-1451]RAX59261.1 bifunctional 3,4-dihydroxy-2-butanone 4-phosphate synthase/GTP cyclohydrolase II [Helicobacter sp. 15-1451]